MMLHVFVLMRTTFVPRDRAGMLQRSRRAAMEQQRG